ncbi:hypothetical protein RB197_00005, partial [Streptomyces umbrinus]
MPRGISDDQYAAILNKRQAGDLPKRGDEGSGLVRHMRDEGRGTEPGPKLKTAFLRHGVTVYQDAKDRHWKLPKAESSHTLWTDSQYAQALDSLEVGTPLGRRHVTGKGVRDGVEVDVPVGTFVSRLLDTSSKDRVHARAFEPVLVGALARHNLFPVQVGPDKWKIRKAIADASSVQASYGAQQQYPHNPVASASSYNPAQGASGQVAALAQGMEGMSVAASAAPSNFLPMDSSLWDASYSQVAAG